MRGAISTGLFLAQWLLVMSLQAAPIPDAPPLPGETKGGRLSLLSINVAEQGQQVQEQKRLTRIGSLLQGFEIVLVQKNFWYKRLLRDGYAGDLEGVGDPVENGFRSTYRRSSNMGLTTLSRYDSTPLEPVRWPKREFQPPPNRDGTPSKGRIRVHGGQPDGGVKVSTLVLQGENNVTAELDVYNVDLSGEFKGSVVSDVNERITLLFETIRARDDQRGRRPLIIAGNYNFNLLGHYREEFESNLIHRFHSGLGVAQAFSVLDGFVGDHRGKWIFYRSNDNVRLEPLQAMLLGKRFRSRDGRPLVVQTPAAVTFNWFYKESDENEEESRYEDFADDESGKSSDAGADDGESDDQGSIDDENADQGSDPNDEQGDRDSNDNEQTEDEGVVDQTDNESEMDDGSTTSDESEGSSDGSARDEGVTDQDNPESERSETSDDPVSNDEQPLGDDSQDQTVEEGTAVDDEANGPAIDTEEPQPSPVEDNENPEQDEEQGLVPDPTTVEETFDYAPPAVNATLPSDQQADEDDLVVVEDEPDDVTVDFEQPQPSPVDKSADTELEEVAENDVQQPEINPTTIQEIFERLNPPNLPVLEEKPVLYPGSQVEDDVNAADQ